MPSDLLEADIWWKGPLFITQNSISKFDQDYCDVDPEIVHSKVSLSSAVVYPPVPPLYESCENFEEAIRMYAYCLRFFRNVRNKTKSDGDLTVIELDLSLKCIIRSIQSEYFSDEIKFLKSGDNLKNKHKQIAKLNPFLDSENLLRVGGRLINSNLPVDQRHPYLLPAHNNFCRLLVKSYHLKNLHVGPSSLMSFIRQRFWVLSLRKLCKDVCFKCIRCFRTKPKSIHQLMGQLPPERLEGFKIFENVGVDLCGPFYVASKIRSKVSLKVYVCLFICFSTKACHLEVVEDLSTKSFLFALQRFIGRRSACANMFSDNGTNFVGAKNELEELYILFKSEQHQQEVFKFCVSRGINWKTIPARSPHFGGLWEAGIKSAKYLLKRELGNYKPTLEEFNTLVVQVEACLNSRPLTPLSEDPSDLSVLTPGHFLVGKPLNALPEPSLSHLDFNRLSHYQKVTQILQNFWSRWSREYLCTLQERNKWLAPQDNVKLGSLVLLKEDNLPPLKWVLGRVVETHPGVDGKIRVVTVKTATNTLKRAITKICILPIDQDQIDMNITKE